MNEFSGFAELTLAVVPGPEYVLYTNRLIACVARCSAVSDESWFWIVRSSGADRSNVTERFSSVLRILMLMLKLTGRLEPCPSSAVTLVRTVSTAVMFNVGSAIWPIHST